MNGDIIWNNITVNYSMLMVSLTNMIWYSE